MSDHKEIRLLIRKVINENEMLDEIERRELWKKEITQVAKQLKIPLTNYLGSGVWGIAYEIPGNKVLKITEHAEEIENAKHLVGKKNKLLADIYNVYSIKGDKIKKVIVMEKLQPLTKDYIKALDIFGGYFSEFYNNEWTWGEIIGHEEDFDNFLKQAKYDGIPLTNIYSDLIQILEEASSKGIHLGDLHEGNLGLKNGQLAAFDLS
jgi:hypothetical protein